MTTKRKKWKEEEEVTLITSYSALSSALSRLKTRQKKFQPVADRVNAVHHHHDPSSFPFLWSWRDVSVKIQNMRSQYLGVKHKILLPSSSPHSNDPPQFDWELGDHLWSNFLRYKNVFGDLDLDLDSSRRHEQDVDDDDDDDEEEDDEEVGVRWRRRRRGRRWWDEEERERWRRRRRREERREEEEMEWVERMVGMQMDHEKQVLQMHADACQAQLQVVGIMTRLVCQFLGSMVGGGDGGLSHQVLQNLGNQQQQQQDQGSMGADNAKSDTSSPGHYM